MPLQSSASPSNPLRLSEILSEFAGTRETYITGSGTSTAPAGADWCVVKAWGAGGGGAGYDNDTFAVGQNGGGGAFVIKAFAVTAGVTQVGYSVGVGGGGGISGGVGAGNGGDTTISNAVSLTAGGGQAGAAGPGGQGAGGTATGGDPLSENGNSNGAAGGSQYGGGAAGFAPGGGGAGGSSPFQNGTAGQNGKVIIEWYDTAELKASILNRGGTYVPDIQLNATVPTSGTTEFSDYLSGSSVGFGPDVQLVSEVGATFNGVAVTSVTFSSDGTYEGNCSYSNEGAGAFISGNFSARPWASGYGAGTDIANYWIYAETITSGTSMSGTRDTWLQMNTNRTWTNSASAGDDFWELRFKIAASNGGTVIDEINIEFDSLGAGIN